MSCDCAGQLSALRDRVAELEQKVQAMTAEGERDRLGSLFSDFLNRKREEAAAAARP